jgi:Tfp pilus assembly protein PilN
MMRRIDLIPESYQLQRQQRRTVAFVVVAALAALVVLLVYWLSLGMRVSEARNELDAVSAKNAGLQSEISSLQPFAQLETQVNTKRSSLAMVMAGDVDWPSIFTEIALILPRDLWLSNVVASAGMTEGATAVGTETAVVRLTGEQPFGRIQFQGTSLTMPEVSRLIAQLGASDHFNAAWLNTATEAEVSNTEVFTFDSTVEMTSEVASGRFQEASP